MPTIPKLAESYRALSPRELIFLWQGHPKTTGKSPAVVEYDDVIKADSLNRVFGKSDSVILFYPNLQRGGTVAGHYVACNRHPEARAVYFYDPYGLKPDKQKAFASDRPGLYDERENTLIRHLLDSGYDVDYSHHKHQSTKPGVATCGRHSLNRCLYDNLTNDQYDQLLRHAAKTLKKGFDDTVTTLWV